MARYNLVMASCPSCGARWIKPYLSFGHEYLMKKGYIENCAGGYLFALHKASKDGGR